jgi:hypothetical protein
MKSKILAIVLAVIFFLAVMCGIFFILDESGIISYTEQAFSSVSAYVQDRFGADNRDYAEITAGRYCVFCYLFLGIITSLYLLGFSKGIDSENSFNFRSMTGVLRVLGIIAFIVIGGIYLVNGIISGIEDYGNYYMYLWGNFWLVLSSPIVYLLAVSVGVLLATGVYKTLSPKKAIQ